MSVHPAAEVWLDGSAPWRQTRRLARALTAIENGDDDAAWARAAHRRAGRAMTVGLTGPPGVGKSTLTAVLAREIRRRGQPVAVLAFDPTSPLTGGAVLGDRVRMADLETDAAVFIRSMASRGVGGGLALAAAAATDLLDAAGFPWILIETVGAGQAQTRIRRSADVVLLVAAPGLGDGVQAMKSGTMEIADVFVVNKSDLPGATAALRALKDSLELGQGGDALDLPPVISTVARTGLGGDEVIDALESCFGRLARSGEIASRRRARFRRRVLDLYRREVNRLALGAVDAARDLDAEADSQQNRDPYELADRLMERFVADLRSRRDARDS